MKDLKQLIAITSRKRIGKIEILQDSLPKKSIQSKLYNIVNDSEDPDEDFIAARLYGKEIDHTDVRFVKQKSRLKEKLLNTILFIEPNDKFLKLKTYAYKQLYFGKVLQFLNSYILAQKILKKALSVAEKIELFDVAYDAVYQLLSIAALTGEKQEFNSLKTTLLKYEVLRDRQLNAKCNYYDLTLNISDPKITNSQRELMIDETIAQLTGLKDYKKHYALKELVYRLTIIKYNIQNDYEAILKYCKEAIKSLLNFEFLPSDSYFHFKYTALDAYYKLNRHQEGIRFIDQVSNNSRFKVSGQNLHLVKKYEVLYSFGELNFDDANETIVEFMSDRAFQKQTEIVKEMWKLYQAYAEWGIKTLQNQGVIKLENQVESNQSKFRIFKFLNEVPTLSKDKYGYNISLMIIQFLHHLSEFDHGAIIQRIDAMKVYRTRYLRDESLKRLHTFIGMLLKIEKLSFNVNEIEINNKDGYTYLKENPDNLPISDYEIVPFEKVWDLILEHMRASGRSRFAYAS